MTLKQKLLLATTFLHLSLFSVAFIFREQLESFLVLVEVILVLSFTLFYQLIIKALQPLEYIETFSTLLKEQEFTARFSALNQPDLDRLIDQFNIMLEKLHHERLEMGEQKGVYQKLMAESPIGVVLLDYDGRLSDINPASEQLLSLKKNNLIGKNLAQLSKTQLRYLSDIAVDSYQLIEVGQGRQLKIAHYEIRDRGFNRSFYMLYELTSDIVALQKSAYEKLIRLMSHEVNNTIAITNSLLESCLTFREQLDPESAEDFENAINIVINRNASLNQFMQGYSNVVKLEKPIKTSFDLSKMLRDLSTLFYAECNNRNITINLQSEQKLCIIADANLFEQVLVNLLQNGLEAISKEGEINITLQQDKDMTHLLIEDTGCGISAEIERQLFTPFFTSKEFGQGVGLMLVRDILNLHDIPYQLVNRKDCQGASFSLSITH
ncbi:MAG: nitrogen fixation/metabolism regulation signal transduction histidine kinase [Arenicella sp.]|jgi:nitrogen fixation/metabolism regulation signal transduction histidine kinase